MSLANNDKNHWSNFSEEELCVKRMLEKDAVEKTCDVCKEKSIFWVEEAGGTLCISCAHDWFCDLMHEYDAWEQEQIDACYR